MTKAEWIMVAVAFVLGYLAAWAWNSRPMESVSPPVPEVRIYGVE